LQRHDASLPNSFATLDYPHGRNLVRSTCGWSVTAVADVVRGQACSVAGWSQTEVVCSGPGFKADSHYPREDLFVGTASCLAWEHVLHRCKIPDQARIHRTIHGPRGSIHRKHPQGTGQLVV